MHPLLLELLPLIHKGYCCSQLLMQIFLQSVGQEYEDHASLVRAMQGLCVGMGGQEGPCGLLASGACVLSCVAGRGRDDESMHPSLLPMVQEYHEWFLRHTQSNGMCCTLLASFNAQQQEKHTPLGGHSFCGNLLADCWEEICTLLESYHMEMELRS